MQILGRAARIAAIHQYGLADKPSRGANEVRYPRRELLGFTDADLDQVRDTLLAALAA